MERSFNHYRSGVGAFSENAHHCLRIYIEDSARLIAVGQTVAQGEGYLLDLMIPVIIDWTMLSQVPELIKECIQNSTNTNITSTVANTHSAFMLFCLGLNSRQGNPCNWSSIFPEASI